MNIIPGRPRHPQFDWQPVPTEHQELLQDRQLSQAEYDRLMDEATEHRLPVISAKITKRLDIDEADTVRLPHYTSGALTALLDHAPERHTSGAIPILSFVSPECPEQRVFQMLSTFCKWYLADHGTLPQALRISKDNYDVMCRMGWNWYSYQESEPISLYHDAYILPHLKCDEVRVAPRGNERDTQERQRITPRPKRMLLWTDLLGWTRRMIFKMPR